MVSVEIHSREQLHIKWSRSLFTTISIFVVGEVLCESYLRQPVVTIDLKIFAFVEHEESKDYPSGKNSDNACFAWAVVPAAYSMKSHSQRASKYCMHYSDIFNLRGMRFSMKIHQIPSELRTENLTINHVS